MTLRVAVISDIHGNAVALDAVLEEIERDPVDRLVCLGDALQGGSEPARVVDLLVELGCPVVMGNADAFLVGEDAGVDESPRMLEVREWTLEQLGPRGTAFVKTFVPTVEVGLEAGEKMLCFHGSPRSFDEIIVPSGGMVERVTGIEFRDKFVSDETVHAMLEGVDARVLTGGHTHLQWTRSFGDRTYFSPGSVGLAYNRLLPRESFHLYPAAEYAVLTSSGRDVAIEFRHFLLDVEALTSAVLSSGHPYAHREAARYRPPAG